MGADHQLCACPTYAQVLSLPPGMNFCVALTTSTSWMDAAWMASAALYDFHRWDFLQCISTFDGGLHACQAETCTPDRLRFTGAGLTCIGM